MRRQALIIFLALLPLLAWGELDISQWKGMGNAKWEAVPDSVYDADFMLIANITTHPSAGMRPGKYRMWNLTVNPGEKQLEIALEREVDENSGFEIVRDRFWITLPDGTLSKASCGGIGASPAALRLIQADSVLTLEYGENGPKEIWHAEAAPIAPARIAFASGDRYQSVLNFASLTRETYASPAVVCADTSDEAWMRSLRDSDDPLEGIWEMFEHTEETSLAAPGGDYRLGIVRRGTYYDIFYISGAKASAGQWIPGMRKGGLRASGVADLYRAEWIDADMYPVREPSALLQGDFLTINFPYLHSSIVFRRCR